MKLDLVHDLQAVYRQILNSMSRPGLISNIAAEAAKVDMETGCFKSTFILALLLLDTEVTFKVYDAAEPGFTQLISRLTYAQAAATAEADFIFVLQNAGGEALTEALTQAYAGDLLNPHKAATLIIETDYAGNDRELVLTGPGIAGENYVKIAGTDGWIEERAAKNKEYPLGVDIIFADRTDNLLGLPRTTQIQRWSD